MRRFTGLDLDPDRHLVTTCGSTKAMIVAMMIASDPGDKAIVFRSSMRTPQGN
jgi:aspartate/methionine/tyrosine aminotransferase